MNKAKPYIQILIAGTLLFLLYRSGLLQIDKIRMALNNPVILISGLIIFTAQFMAFALRWKLTTSIIQKIDFKMALSLHLIGQFFNTFVPGGVGGDVVKALELSNQTQQPKASTIALTLIDRVVGLYCLIIFSFLFLLLEIRQQNPAIIKYFLTSLMLFLFSSTCLLARKKIANIFNNFTKTVQNKFIIGIKQTVSNFFIFLDILIDRRKISHFVLISFKAQTLSILFLYIVVTVLTKTTISFLLFFPLACFAFMAMAIPITPGGIGFGQAAFYFIFSFFDIQVAEAALVGISLVQLFYILLSLPGGYFFFRSKNKNKNKGII